MKFDEYVDNSANYFTVVRDAGDAPWFEDPERRAKVAAQLGLTADIPALEVRKALFEKGRK
jgi:hypothetical protein